MNSFWSWYERHYRLNIGLAAGLFLLQLVHLYWLTTDVVFLRLFEANIFSPSRFWELLIIFVDYLEIPALITTSFVYINEVRKGEIVKGLLYFFFINSQWLHIFWITDELVVRRLVGKDAETILPLWLAWIAIGIDYLELPVIYNTTRRFLMSLRGSVNDRSNPVSDEEIASSSDLHRSSRNDSKI